MFKVFHGFTNLKKDATVLTFFCADITSRQVHSTNAAVLISSSA
jgi:hypothetical protein